MRKLLLVVEYDGTDLAGFQVQPAQRTVQGELETALRRVTGEAIRVNGAGRTDARVHATGQVASFSTASHLSTETLARALNATLASDVAVRLAAEAPDSFHARFSARSRVYRYWIWNAPTPTPLGRRFTCHWRGQLDLHAIEQAGGLLVGTHDFASFAGAFDRSSQAIQGSQTSEERPTSVRTIKRLECRAQGRLVEVEVEADAFLPHMVRNVVGTLLLVGSGKLAAGQMGEVLGAKSRAAAGPTAPPQGLCLTAVRYPPYALGRAEREAMESIEKLGEPGGRLPFAEADYESQWRPEETSDSARSK